MGLVDVKHRAFEVHIFLPHGRKTTTPRQKCVQDVQRPCAEHENDSEDAASGYEVRNGGGWRGGHAAALWRAQQHHVSRWTGAQT